MSGLNRNGRPFREFYRKIYRHLLYRPSYSLLAPADYSPCRFDEEIRRARGEYQGLIACFGAELKDIERRFCHPVWQGWKAQIGNYLLSNVAYDFLNYEKITYTMVRRKWGTAQKIEEEYITQAASRQPLLREMLGSFVESRVGEPWLESRRYRCSSNTIGMLFTFARILEHYRGRLPDPLTVVEFGGGYGNLARIFKMAYPRATYCIIDFPELLLLQSLYLRLNFATGDVILQQSVPVTIKPGAFNLMPVYSVAGCAISGNLFISTFGLSESPEYVQELVIRKRFFGCSDIYITGLEDSSNPDEDKFVHHCVIHQGAKACFPWVVSQRFHAIDKSYELIGSVMCGGQDRGPLA